MTAVTASSPLGPALDFLWIEELRLSERSHCRSAYHMILQAERRAVERQANEDIVSARVAADTFSLSSTLSLISSAVKPARQLSLPRDTSGDERSVVFEAGRLFSDKFIRLCAFDRFSYVALHEHALPRTPTLRVLPLTRWKI